MLPSPEDSAESVDVQATVFSLRTPLLAEGRSDTTLARSDLMSVRIKVYAQGGENALHAHTQEDHTFVVLMGAATFEFKDGATAVVHPHEGIFLPRHAVYKFASTGSENLVLLRVGAQVEGASLDRIGPDGKPLPGHSQANKHVEGVPLTDEYFGG